MKKIFPILAVLGSAAALIAYKMKKEEEKQIIDLDQGLLYDDEPEDMKMQLKKHRSVIHNIVVKK